MAANRLDRTGFLRSYRLAPTVLEEANLSWIDLEAIYEDHSKNIGRLQFTGNYVGGLLQQLDEVHSIRIRIKHPEHLIEKIIRKKLEQPSRSITPEDYQTSITDLIGVRALHLFKEEWTAINDFIVTTWELEEKPLAYIRLGDRPELISLFEARGCEVQPHKYGYRSVHYLIRSQPSKQRHITELQVRTIFEEGWSEIDHRIRYPYDIEHPKLLSQSRILNNVAGSADDLGSEINLLKNELDSQREK